MVYAGVGGFFPLPVYLRIACKAEIVGTIFAVAHYDLILTLHADGGTLAKGVRLMKLSIPAPMNPHEACSAIRLITLIALACCHSITLHTAQVIGMSTGNYSECV